MTQIAKNVMLLDVLGSNVPAGKKRGSHTDDLSDILIKSSKTCTFLCE